MKRWWSRPGVQLQAAVRTISLAVLRGRACVCYWQRSGRADWRSCGYVFNLLSEVWILLSTREYKGRRYILLNAILILSRLFYKNYEHFYNPLGCKRLFLPVLASLCYHLLLLHASSCRGVSSAVQPELCAAPGPPPCSLPVWLYPSFPVSPPPPWSCQTLNAASGWPSGASLLPLGQCNSLHCVAVNRNFLFLISRGLYLGECQGRHPSWVRGQGKGTDALFVW